MEKRISRREFLKLSGAAAGAVLIPRNSGIIVEGETGENLWPKLKLEEIPQGETKEVLSLIPEIRINSDGLLSSSSHSLPLAETDWSKQNRFPIDPDALVVHWDGHDTPSDITINNILYGYNEVRSSREGDYEFVTSAHATIGPHTINETTSESDSPISILQTQKPEAGFPTVSSHLRSNLSRERAALLNARHPINSQLLITQFYGIPDDYSYLPDALSGVPQDLNRRTISLELVGKNFDREETHPDPQLTANAVGVILAYMKHHPQIKFANITGHHEIQIDKADPGKRYMAEVRLLLALKILAGEDKRLKDNLFGPFMDESGDKMIAVKRFFDFHWDWLAASFWGHQKNVFAWENQTGFWTIYRNLFPENQPELADRFVLPVHAAPGREIKYGNRYGIPDYHEGLDINVQSGGGKINEDLGDPIYATANGKVIFAGEIPGRPGLGKTIVMEHILSAGGKALSLYAHLDQIGVTKGQLVGIEEQIGAMGNSGGQTDSHLHFAIMPASSKRERELSFYLQLYYDRVKRVEVNPYLEDEEGKIYIVPDTVNRQFVELYYFEPLSFIEESSK